MALHSMTSVRVEMMRLVNFLVFVIRKLVPDPRRQGLSDVSA
jgi:hypothetical protein